jgi:thymidylate synthase (FAD)
MPAGEQNTIPVLDQGYVRLVDHMGNDLSIVNAARVSYAKESAEFGERDERLLNYLVRNNEFSPFRHCALTFEVYAPLFVARQWFKYVVASAHLDDQIGWNESSRRYITEDPVYHIPAEWRMAPENKKQGSGENADPATSQQYTDMLKEFLARGEDLYNLALDSGLAPEQARLFLPAYGMYVRWRWTTSLAAVMHFLNERLEHKAQLEIQNYAAAVRDLIVPVYPKALSRYND